MREITDSPKTISEKISLAIDGAIGVISPERAFKRKAFRNASRMMASTSYKGAAKNRLRKSWSPFGGSPDEDLLADLPTLRERSRDLNRNDGTASGITDTMTCNVVGTGIKAQSRIDKDTLGVNDEDTDIFQKRAERSWERWIPYAHSAGILDFYEIQSLVDRQVLENGEVILLPLRIEQKNRPYSLAIDIIEADRLDTPFDLKGDKSIRSGIKIGERGEPLIYYIKKTHPGDMTLRKTWNANDFIAYDAVNSLGQKNVFHLYWMNRPGQTRGIPFFAPVLTYFKDLAEYMDAELIAARIAACFAIFVTKDNAVDVAGARTTSIDSKGKRREEIEPGIFEYLNPGEKIETANSNRPGGSFEPFVNRMLRSISAALGLPYELVAKDFSKVNYSSARAALLEARRYFRRRQEWLARKLCQPVWELLLEEAYLRGELKADTFYENRLEWVRAKWITPGWQWVDPVKEAESSKLAIDSGLSSLADECAAQGKDWEEVIGQKVRELVTIKKLEEQNGITLIKDGKISDLAKQEEVPINDKANQ